MMPMFARHRLNRLTNVEDLRSAAERRVPRAFFQYTDHGSYAQSTVRANRRDLEAIELRQRVAIDVDDRSLRTAIIGEAAELPLAIAPIGLCGMMHGDGEILVCRAAQAAGIPFCLSTMSICSIEDVAEAVDLPFWFQLYVMRDRGFVRELIERAIAAKCSALMPTLDLQILGERYCDVKNGMTVPPEITLANILDVATKPAWALSVLRGKRKTFGNLAGRINGMEGVTSLAQWMAKQFDPTLNWRDIEWIRSIWPGKLILKGILDVEDAKIAAGLARRQHARSGLRHTLAYRDDFWRVDPPARRHHRHGDAQRRRHRLQPAALSQARRQRDDRDLGPRLAHQQVRLKEIQIWLNLHQIRPPPIRSPSLPERWQESAGRRRLPSRPRATAS
jgi:L-lactate dehydrogenase (cytochrome)